MSGFLTGRTSAIAVLACLVFLSLSHEALGRQNPGAAATRYVSAGGDLQAALNEANPGDTIVLGAGATFTGPFVLLDKGDATAEILMRTSTVRVKAVHLTEIRSALDEVYVALARAAPVYTDPSVTAETTTIKAVHVTELRSAILTLE